MDEAATRSHEKTEITHPLSVKAAALQSARSNRLTWANTVPWQSSARIRHSRSLSAVDNHHHLAPDQILVRPRTTDQLTLDLGGRQHTHAAVRSPSHACDERSQENGTGGRRLWNHRAWLAV